MAFKAFIVFDFDLTLADTSKPSLHGINVQRAYDIAVATLFGDNGMKIYYDHLGGLQNREPSELVMEITRVAKEKNIPLPHSGPASETTDQLVQLKLDCFLPEISPQWPHLYPGVKEFLSQVKDGTIPADVGIVSSGHDAFIDKTFKVNGLDTPTILVTSDAIRKVIQPKQPLYKPNPHQLARAHGQWIKGKDYRSEDEGHTGRAHGRSRIMFIGDDHVKDGRLAERYRVIYGHVLTSQPNYHPHPEQGQIAIASFFDLMDILLVHASDIREGQALSEVFLQRPDHELFPPRFEGKRPSTENSLARAGHFKEQL